MGPRFDHFPLIFAPMEGVTDESYRLVVEKLYPEWDYLATDFFRIPTVGRPQKKSLLEHLGREVYANQGLREKTMFQFLTSPKAQTDYTLGLLSELSLPWIDLNLGCPSKKVNSHKGGAYLLSDFPELKKILQICRKRIDSFFSVKIRIGLHDDGSFDDLIRLFSDEGAELITIHGRTRDQGYKGVASWDYFDRAKRLTSVPIVANGDIWNLTDIKKIKEQTSADGAMIARGALQTPWLAKLAKREVIETSNMRALFLQRFLQELEKEYLKRLWPKDRILRRFKGHIRYPLDIYPRSEEIKKALLRAQSLDQFKLILKNELAIKA